MQSGALEHRFELDSGIEATTPPAIATDDSIVLGTSQGVYALR
jgi:hypothetical protein